MINRLRPWGGLIIVLVLMVLVLSIPVGSRLVQAAKPIPAGTDTNEPCTAQLGWGDDGTSEVGVEWINDFPGTGDDRSHWDESCDGLYNGLTGLGWMEEL